MSTLVLIGPHGAGKTTYGVAYARERGWVFHDEIGRRLMEANRAAGANATVRPECFDDRVLRAELARDREWHDRGDSRPTPWHLRRIGESVCHIHDAARSLAESRHRIVETWHLGNLAYALLRNPRWARPRLGQVRTVVLAAADHEDLLVQPLTASPEALRLRLSEPGAAEVVLPFFREVADLTCDLALSWRLCVLPPLDTTAPQAAARGVA